MPCSLLSDREKGAEAEATTTKSNFIGELRSWLTNNEQPISSARPSLGTERVLCVIPRASRQFFVTRDDQLHGLSTVSTMPQMNMCDDTYCTCSRERRCAGKFVWKLCLVDCLVE